MKRRWPGYASCWPRCRWTTTPWRSRRSRRSGPNGQFLHSKHTLHHYKEQWYPRLFERDNYDGWQAKGAATLLERAAARVDEILDGHERPVLPADVEGELARIVAAADARVVQVQ